jgi:hypothetical protein
MKIEYVHGTNIVSVKPREVDMHFSAVSMAEAYWDAQRSGTSLPSRDDINPRGIEGALDYAFILVRIAPGVARFRIAGAHLSDLMTMGVHGMPLTAMFNAEARAEISQTVEDVFMRPQIANLTLKSAGGIARPTLSAKMLLAPLKSEPGEPMRILGCLQSNGKAGRQPRRFSVVQNLREIIGPTAQTTQPRQQVGGFGEGAPQQYGQTSDQTGATTGAKSGEQASTAAQSKGPDAARPTLRLV